MHALLAELLSCGDANMADNDVNGSICHTVMLPLYGCIRTMTLQLPVTAHCNNLVQDVPSAGFSGHMCMVTNTDHHNCIASFVTMHSAGMWAPGLVGLVLGAALLLTVRDSPEAIGYPPVEAVEEKVCLVTDMVELSII